MVDGTLKSYWADGLFITDGRVYGTELVGEEFRPVCLGSEADIIPVLKGDVKGKPDRLLRNVCSGQLYPRNRGNGRRSRTERR